MLERPPMDLLDTRRPRALLLAFCLLVWLPGLFTIPPTDRDESRFAQASKQMLETGDYVRIMNGTEPRNRKPIGVYWLQAPFAATARAAGLATANPVWPYRIPSLLGAIAAVLATFEAGCVLAGRRVALLAAGMLAASVILTVETHLAKTDAALLGATTAAMAVLARAYLGRPLGRGAVLLFWLAMAAGILLKGPITPMVAAFTAVALVIADRRARWLLALRPAWGVPVLLAAVLPWFVAIGLATHGAFFSDAVGGDLGRKLASGDDAHGGPPGLHLLLLPLLAFPATLPVIAAIPGSWRTRREPAMRFLLAWTVPSWLLFEAVPTKLPHYTLPLYPAVFLMAAAMAVQVATPRWRAAGISLAAASAAVLGLGMAALPIAAGGNVWLGGPAALAACLLGWLATQTSRPTLAIAAMPVLTMAMLGFELPRLHPLWLAPAVTQAVSAAGLRGPLVTAGFHEPSLMFLAGTGTELARDGGDAARLLADGAGAAIVASQDLAAFQAEAARLGLAVRPRGQMSGFNYSRGRRTTLTLFEPLRRPSAEGRDIVPNPDESLR